MAIESAKILKILKITCYISALLALMSYMITAYAHSELTEIYSIRKELRRVELCMAFTAMSSDLEKMKDVNGSMNNSGPVEEILAEKCASGMNKETKEKLDALVGAGYSDDSTVSEIADALLSADAILNEKSETLVRYRNLADRRHKIMGTTGFASFWLGNGFILLFLIALVAAIKKRAKSQMVRDSE